MTKYSLVRKKGFQWTICSIHSQVTGELVKGAKSPDIDLVRANRDRMAKVFPDEVYAIIELEG